MKQTMKELLSAAVYILLTLVILFGVGSCVRWDYKHYQRKYPNTSTFDYIWDKMGKR